MAHFPFRAFENNPFKGEINGSLWSISFEFWCYIGVLVLGLTGMLKRPLVVLGLFSMAVAFNLHLHLSGWKPGGGILGAIVGYPVFWATVSPLFLGGMLMHLYRDRIAVNGAGAVVCLLGLGAACVIPHGMLVAQPTLGTYLLFCVATTPLIPRFNLVKYGDYSYGVYLYAFPIQQLIMQAIGHSVHPLLLFVLALPPSLIAGALSWYCVERWFLKRSDRSPRAKAGESQEPAIAAIGPGHPPSA